MNAMTMRPVVFLLEPVSGPDKALLKGGYPVIQEVAYRRMGRRVLRTRELENRFCRQGISRQCPAGNGRGLYSFSAGGRPDILYRPRSGADAAAGRDRIVGKVAVGERTPASSPILPGVVETVRADGGQSALSVDQPPSKQ